MTKQILALVSLACGLALSVTAQTNLIMKSLRPDRDRPPPESWRRITAARAYLARTQNQDGSWGDDSNRDRETPLALIGFTNGNVPGPFKNNLLLGVKWLLASRTPVDSDLIAIRIIAAAELLDDGQWRESEQLRSFILKEMKSLTAEPSANWRDLLSISHLPKTTEWPSVIPKQSVTRTKYLNKKLAPSDLADDSDLRVFILKTFESALWGPQNAKVASSAVQRLWQKQKEDGSFPALEGSFGEIGATGLMFLQNKTWMQASYQYFYQEE